MKPSVDPDFTNVLSVDPDIIVDLRYATTNNFTHQVIYNFTTAIARTETVKKLGIASQLLKEQGYRLKIWDAFRPVEAQKMLFEVVPDPTWVAKPNPNFSHQKGVTFDLTLTDLDGNEIAMPTPFDDFTPAAKRNAEWPRDIERNYNILNDAMEQAGFVGYENEWWDFRDADQDSFGPKQADPNDYTL